MKKILLSLAMVIAVGAVVAGATGAFFSDTETSTGNTFTAGAIDLKIDNESYVTDVNGKLVESPNTTWLVPDDLDGHLFFNFDDLKPGDIGEDTISIHVDSNDAWLCAAAQITEDSDVDYTEPELGDDNTIDKDDPLNSDGELDEELNFVWWADDGDNVLEDCRTDVAVNGCVPEQVFLQGPISAMGQIGQIALADSQNNIWGPVAPLDPEQTYYIGKAWCFGDLTLDPVPQDEQNNLGPLDRGNDPVTGILCDGAPVNNASQTDRVVGDIQFYSEQYRNNTGFLCSQGYQPEFPVAQRPTVGADLTIYTQPTQCDLMVDKNTAETGTNFNTIQDAINAASGGETICVDDDTYTEDVNVNKANVTLAGTGASNTTTINGVGVGEPGALVISADGVTVEGFNVIGTGVSAIRISGARDGITIQDNKATAASGKNAFLADGGQSNHTISNNVFEGNASQLVYVNGSASVATASTNVDFLNNTFGGTATGPLLGIESEDSLVSQNKFSGTTTYTSIESWEGDLLVHENNFDVDDVAGPIHVTNSVNGNTVHIQTLDAQNNWWGDTDPSDNTSGSVDSSSPAGSAFPEN